MPKLPKFMSSNDKTPKYTVKDVAAMMELSTHTIRYYENSGLIPEVDRTPGNIRMFSDYSLSWLQLVHCLRATGLPIEGVKRYIDLCNEGDSTIPERAEIINQQEYNLQEQLKNLKRQMKVLKHKKQYYQNLLANKGISDTCNPATNQNVEHEMSKKQIS